MACLGGYVTVKIDTPGKLLSTDAKQLSCKIKTILFK